jgi:hypothetical protein
VPTSSTSIARRRPLVAPVALGAVLVLALTVAGCSAAAPRAVSATLTRGPDVAAAKTAPPAPVVPAAWPLTGVVAADVVSRPALAVKIENPALVRPQTGLDQADLVWEEVVEGGITRFVVVFNSAVPGEVGPIRSVRPMDPAIVAPMRGLIAFSGGQVPYVNALKAAGIQTLSNDAGDGGFYRTGKKAPHNVFGSPAKFWGQADANHQVPPPEQFQFARTADQATAATGGAPTSSVQVKMSGYSQPGWTWDAASATWLRSEAGVEAKAASGARLVATNVIALRVQVVQTSGRDPAGNPIPETKLVGTGDAIVATGGKTVAATWTKGAIDAPLALSAAGAPVKLAPGKTWIELVPTSGGGSVTVG